MPQAPKWLAGVASAMIFAVIGVVGCGGGGKDTATPLKVGVSEKGKTASFSLPKSVDGGLVELQLTNEGKAPPMGCSSCVTRAITPLKKSSKKSPAKAKKRRSGSVGKAASAASWAAKAARRPSTWRRGTSSSPTPRISAKGNRQRPNSKLPKGPSGDLPDTSGTVVAEETGEDEWAWDVSGLRAGKNQITFESQGDEAIRLIVAMPLTGKVPPLSQIKKDLAAENGPPPSYLDFESAQSTAVLDRGKSQTTPFELKEPGTYLLFCPLTDRDGGKSHDQEGLLSIEEVQ